ncbi:hypothetical protein SUGI_0781340 [Cryptomeria japonica]|nr:hypothetical protein SUGI_0781340 [Cryptomeria japonica]
MDLLRHASVISRVGYKRGDKRGRVSMEYLEVQHDEGITEAAILSHQQIQGEMASQENGESGSLRQRKMKPKFQCKRQIPGGPDPQHH